MRKIREILEETGKEAERRRRKLRRKTQGMEQAVAEIISASDSPETQAAKDLRACSTSTHTSYEQEKTEQEQNGRRKKNQ